MSNINLESDGETIYVTYGRIQLYIAYDAGSNAKGMSVAVTGMEDTYTVELRVDEDGDFWFCAIEDDGDECIYAQLHWLFTGDEAQEIIDFMVTEQCDIGITM